MDVRALYSPEILQAGAVKGLMTEVRLQACQYIVAGVRVHFSARNFYSWGSEGVNDLRLVAATPSSPSLLCRTTTDSLGRRTPTSARLTKATTPSATCGPSTLCASPPSTSRGTTKIVQQGDYFFVF